MGGMDGVLHDAVGFAGAFDGDLLFSAGGKCKR